MVTNRQRLDAQQIENEQVAKEFGALEEGKHVYKLVGPVLMKQDTKEAQDNVKNRLERIKASIKTVEEQLGELGAKTESKKMEVCSLLHPLTLSASHGPPTKIVHVQTQLQQQAQTAEQTAAALPQAQEQIAA